MSRTISHLCLLLLTLSALVSCQTQEQIRREQQVDNLAMQMVQNQQLTADATVRLQNLQEQLGLLTGEVENKDYKLMTEMQDEFKQIKEKVELMQSQLETQQKEVDSMRSRVDEQKKLLDNILKTLQNLSADASKKKSKYQATMDLYGKARYDKAKVGLLQLLNDKSLNADQRARVLHNLGMIAYMDKRWSDAQGYFGKLLTQYPKASQVKNGLLFIAKSFAGQNKNAEAKQTLNELIRKYPKARQTPQAKKMLKKL